MGDWEEWREGRLWLEYIGEKKQWLFIEQNGHVSFLQLPFLWDHKTPPLLQLSATSSHLAAEPRRDGSLYHPEPVQAALGFPEKRGPHALGFEHGSNENSQNLFGWGSPWTRQPWAALGSLGGAYELVIRGWSKAE